MKTGKLKYFNNFKLNMKQDLIYNFYLYAPSSFLKFFPNYLNFRGHLVKEYDLGTLFDKNNNHTFYSQIYGIDKRQEIVSEAFLKIIDTDFHYLYYIQSNPNNFEYSQIKLREDFFYIDLKEKREDYYTAEFMLDRFYDNKFEILQNSKKNKFLISGFEEHDDSVLEFLIKFDELHEKSPSIKHIDMNISNKEDLKIISKFSQILY